MATITTTVKGANRTNATATPPVRLDVTQQRGLLRTLFDSYTFDSADELGVGGIIELFKIPAGARILEMEVNMPASGATGQADLGWAASSDASESADQDGFYAGATETDPGGGAIARLKMLNSAAGYHKKFSAEVQCQFQGVEITADSGGDTWDVTCTYVLD